jgi:hypothetical protein
VIAAAFAAASSAASRAKRCCLRDRRTVHNREHARVLARKLPIKFEFNHGVSFAFYFDDPDGNMIEVYCPTGALEMRQPYVEPLDLTQPDDVLLQQVSHVTT